MDSDSVEIAPASWPELLAELVALETSGWVFRGLSAYGYKIRSKLERTLEGARVPLSEWRIRENAGLTFFKERARHELRELPAEHDLLGWLALMQHYGAPTRLTDWPISPMVACYFAYESIVRGEDSAAVWALNAAGLRSLYGSKFGFGRDHTGSVPTVTSDGKGNVLSKTYPGLETTLETVIADENSLLRQAMEHEIRLPLPLPILRPDRRMAMQQACFVCSGNLAEESGETAFDLLMKADRWPELKQETSKVAMGGRYFGGPVIGGYPFSGPENAIRKIRLPYEWRAQALRSLAKANITADTLLPGLDGVGRTTEIYMQVLAPQSLAMLLEL